MRLTWIPATVALLLSIACPVRAQLTNLFLDDGFEDDTVGAAPNAPTNGSWTGIAGVTVINDLTPGPFNGTNYLRIQRNTGGPATAQIYAEFPTVIIGNTLTATFALLYETNGTTTSAAIQLFSGVTQRAIVYAEPYYGFTNFYSINDSAEQIQSSLAITPGAWQTIKIEYTCGSTNLTLTVNGTSETLTNAVTPGVVDRIRFGTGSTNSIYYIDDEIKVVGPTNPPVNTAASSFVVGATTYNASILADDFNGATLDPQWAPHVSNNGSVAMDGTNSVLIRTGSSGTGTARFRRSTAYINYETDGGLNYGASSNDWALEIKFQMQNETGGFEWESAVGSGYQWSILGGYTTSDTNGWSTVQGFDLRAVRNGLKWSLGWYGGDYPGGVFFDRPSTIDIVPEPSLQAYWLHNNETYTIGLHRKSDGNVDIYFTGNVYDGTTDVLITNYNNQFLATKPLILGANPGGLVVGDWSQLGIGGKMALDSLKIGVVSDRLTVSIAMLPDKNPQLTFTGNPGSNYVVQTATNLTDWVTISTNTADGAGQFIYSDLTATNFTQRFYRGRSQ
jgi:hypothetical protein